MPGPQKIKRIHQIFWDFIGDRTYEDIPEFKDFVNVTQNFCTEHGYRYKMWSKQNCDELIEQEFPEHKQLWEDFRMDIQRCDFIRYCILYKYGGLYLDCDVKPLRNLDEIFETNQYFIHWNDDKKKKPYNAIMFSKKKNPLFLEIITECKRSYYEKVKIKVYETWTGRFVFQTTGHTMLERVFKKSKVHKTSCIHDSLYVFNSSKTYGTKENFVGNQNTALFEDNNASIWYREINKKKPAKKLVTEPKIECPICYEEFPKSRIITTRCNHQFCKTCISQINKCALCRAPLVAEWVVVDNRLFANGVNPFAEQEQVRLLRWISLLG